MTLALPTTPGSATQRPTCLTCRYPLTDLKENRCPECGRAFDPNNPSTFGPRGPVWRRLASFAPPRWLTILHAAIVLALFTLMSLGPPDVPLSDQWVVPVLAIAVGTILFWCIPFIAHVIALAAPRFWSIPHPKSRWRWIAVPATFATCFIVLQSGVVWQMRWATAQRSFNALISNSAAQPNLSAPIWIGTFRVIKVTSWSESSLCFQLGAVDGYSATPEHIVYSPKHFPSYGQVATDIGGGWWAISHPD